VQSYVDSLVNVSNLDSIRKLYPAHTTTGTSGTAAYSEWRNVPAELQSWEAVQAALDVFVQRISVADGAQKVSMRGWYEALQEIGGVYFGNA
jgi:hypothetical protein